MKNRYVWRVVVRESGGTEPRPMVVEADGTVAVEMEAETGAMTEVYFWPPEPGVHRHFLSQSGAAARVKFLEQNGCAAVIQRSKPVQWEGFEDYGHA